MTTAAQAHQIADTLLRATASAERMAAMDSGTLGRCLAMMDQAAAVASVSPDLKAKIERLQGRLNEEQGRRR